MVIERVLVAIKVQILNLVIVSLFFVFFTYSFLLCKDTFMDDYDGI
jgi:hypothetical protein